MVASGSIYGALGLVLLSVAVDCSGFEYSLGRAEKIYVEPLRYPFVALEKDQWLKGYILFASRYYVATTDGRSTIILAGNQSQSDYAENYATSARFRRIYDMTQISETLIVVSDNGECCLRSISRLSSKTERFAGTCGTCAARDGLATAGAQFNANFGLLLVGSYLYILDNSGDSLRRMDLTMMVVTTVVSGSPYLKSPFYLLSMGPNTLLATWSHGVSKISLNNGSVTHVAGVFGKGLQCFDNSTRKAVLSSPFNLELIDDGAVFVADYRSNKIKLLNLSSGKNSIVCFDSPDKCSIDDPWSLLYAHGYLIVGAAGVLQQHRLMRNDINECTTSQHNCHANASCSNTIGSYYCTCQQGFTGDGINQCQDVNECKDGTSVCHADALCYNTFGSHTCICDTGYEGNGYNCSDIDECSVSSSICGNHALCTNINGTYRCSCHRGYADDNSDFCEDVNECSPNANRCSTQSDCLNTDGSYTCHCRDSFVWNGHGCEDVYAHDCPANVTAILRQGDHAQITLVYPPSSTHNLLLPAGTHQHQVLSGSKVCITGIEVVSFAQLPRRLALTADYNGIQCDQLNQFTFTMVQATANHKFSFLRSYCNCSLSGSASVTCLGSTLKVTWNTDQTYQTSNVTEILPKRNETPITLDAHLLELTIIGKTVMFVQPKRNNRNEVVTSLLVPICPEGFQPTADYEDCR